MISLMTTGETYFIIKIRIFNYPVRDYETVGSGYLEKPYVHFNICLVIYVNLNIKIILKLNMSIL